MPPPSDPPFAALTVLSHAIDSLLGGSAGWFRIPPGGYLNVTWLSRKRAYRVTIDVTAGHPFSAETEAFLRELRERLAESGPAPSSP